MKAKKEKGEKGMKLAKKIILSLTITFTMLMALVIGVANVGEKVLSKDNSVSQQNNYTSVSRPKKKEKVEYTYQTDDILVATGSDNIEYTYNPSSNRSGIIAYEYNFKNTMTDKAAAVNIKSIDTTGVNIAYWCGDHRLEKGETITCSNIFELYELPEQNDKVYIYLIVSPKQTNIPVTFSTSIVWWYGVPQKLEIVDSITNTVIATQTIVTNQEIDYEVIDIPDVQAIPSIPEGYYFDGWYLDEKFSIPLEGPAKAGLQLYARYANFPQGSMDYVSYNNGAYTITGNPYLDDTTIVIPSIYNDGEHGDAPVVAIGEYAFYYGSYRELYLPSTITRIEYGAFVELPLTRIDLSNCVNLTSIGSTAFEYCYSLTEVILPSSLISIGSYAFGGCKLNSLILPENLTTIDESAFGFGGISCLYEIYNLSSLPITKGSEDYGWVAYWAKVVHSSLDTPSVFIAVNGINYIKENYNSWTMLGVADNNITSITLDSRTTSIGDYAFSYCNSLTSITLPSRLTSIGSSAFYGCSSLTSITLPSRLTTIGDYAFYNCSSLTSIDLSNCTRLTSIGNYAFYQCSGLTSIILPRSLTTIENSAFYGCMSLLEVYNLSPSLILTKGSTDNGYVAYYAAVIYTSINEPSKLTTINNVIYCMESDTSYIASGVVDSSVTRITLDSRTTAIKNYAFYNYSSLVNITLSSSLTSIGEYAFYYCSSLTSITLPNSLTTIGAWAFSYCRGLTNITIPSNVTDIANYAFYDCSSLTSVTLPNGLTSIGSNAFMGCSSLTSITIPANVTQIGSYAFYNCSKLQTITFDDTTTWYTTSSSNYSGGSSVDVTNSTKNATRLKSTKNYYNYYWYKK